jgi:hypothetical protein
MTRGSASVTRKKTGDEVGTTTGTMAEAGTGTITRTTAREIQDLNARRCYRRNSGRISIRNLGRVKCIHIRTGMKGTGTKTKIKTEAEIGMRTGITEEIQDTPAGRSPGHEQE